MYAIISAFLGILAPATVASLLFGGNLAQTAAGMFPGVSEEFRGRLSPAASKSLYAGSLPRAATRIGGVESLGMELTAISAIVVEAETGEVLFQKNPDKVWPTASLTKLMTALQVAGSGISEAAQIELVASDEDEGGIPYFIPGERLSERELFEAMLIGSANSAAVALARSRGGTAEFVAAMNERARTMGLSSTHFVDPTGLDPKNVSTARDLSALSRTAFAEANLRSAAGASLVTVHPVGGRSREIRSTNTLLSGFLNKSPYAIVAGKTGHLDESRYNLALELQRGGRTVIVVLLGAETTERRFQEAKALATWVFNDLR